jgi:phosphogluconate dehydratase
MSGASGKGPAAIHCTPEALGGGALALLRDGDVVKVCATTGMLSTTADLSTRDPASDPRPDLGTGRELFGMMRRFAAGAEQGASAMLATGGM